MLQDKAFQVPNEKTTARDKSSNNRSDFSSKVFNSSKRNITEIKKKEVSSAIPTDERPLSISRKKKRQEITNFSSNNPVKETIVPKPKKEEKLIKSDITEVMFLQNIIEAQHVPF